MIRCSIQSVIKFVPISALVLSIALAGCKPESLPDPNDPIAGQMVPGEILLRNVNEIASSLDVRVYKGEIDKKQRDVLLEREVKKMLSGIDVGTIPPRQAWQYGDAFRVANDWETAQKLYVTAVKSAATVDRKVNDNLRLARAQAHFGKIDEAIATCRALFTVDPEEKAPIMMAVLYEIVPEAQGKGKDAELARLLEDTIAQHEQTVIDAKSNAGKAFLMARPLHIHKAWFKVAQLFQAAGKVEEARQAIEKDEKSRSKRAAF